ncbi:hypothetical protein [Phenylobacterium sp.]|uniref:hypothetical protein n=1 Tax=Phenylobacterium sp. TaxID=1871053 RepID=UPI002F409B33
MRPLEYLLGLESIILALALGDLTRSLHRLLLAGDRVKWDFLSPLAAIMVLLKIVNHWWRWFRLERIANQLTFEMFLGVVAATVVLYLISAATLPDEVPTGPIDLRAHYTAVSRRLWILFLIQGLLTALVNSRAATQTGGSQFQTLAPYLVILPAALSLVVIRNRAWHTLCLIGLSAFYAFQYFGQVLRA